MIFFTTEKRNKVALQERGLAFKSLGAGPCPVAEVESLP